MDGTDSSSPLPPETTEVLRGPDNIQRRTLETFSWVKEELDGCVESTEIAMNVTLDAIWNGYAQLKKKGVILRVVTEVTPDNISYVRKLMELFEVRHLKGVKSNFGMVDRRECLLYSISHEDQSLSHAIITNAKALVEAQYFLFKTLWNNAIPAQEKIREIGEGIKPPFTETLRDVHEIQRFVFDIVNSAKQEILVLLFPATAGGKGFLREEYKVVIQLLKEAVKQHGIRVRILTSKGIMEQIEKIIAKEKRHEEEKDEGRGGGLLVGVRKQGKFEVHLIDAMQQQQQRLQTNVSILIVDSKVSLVEELKAYHNNNNSNGELSLATYSNSESTVLTYTSIFETLWVQTEPNRLLQSNARKSPSLEVGEG
jgi:two-component system, OmpR family, sensor histidine kinase VicK